MINLEITIESRFSIVLEVWTQLQTTDLIQVKEEIYSEVYSLLHHEPISPRAPAHPAFDLCDLRGAVVAGFAG